VLRLNVANYPNLIPADNPFVNTAGARGEIFAYGLRNPFTAAIKPGTNTIYANDVGQSTWEEINHIQAGKNYGWPSAEGNSTNTAYTNPIYAYNHSGASAAITGGTFYVANHFPSTYRDKYFFSDYIRKWIKVLDPGTKQVTDFATNTVGFLDLDVAPDGSLWGLEVGGNIYKYSFTGTANRAPSAVASASPTTGPTPLTVNFSGAGSSDPDGDPLTYTWELGDGSPNKTGINISHTYTTAGTFAARLTVRDGRGGEGVSQPITITPGNNAPTATITTPAHNALFTAGDTISFSGSGTDPEDGTLPSSAFKWSVVFHHDDHTHPFIDSINNTRSGSFQIPRTGETDPNQWYRIHLTVTDSRGLSNSTFVDVQPRKSTMTLATNIGGLSLALDSQMYPTPAQILGVAGMTRSLSAPLQQSAGGKNYEFVSWSDGGAATHSINTPTSNTTTYTATYRETAAVSLPAIADAYVRDGTHANSNFGQVAEMQVKRSSTANSGNNRETYLKFDLASAASIGSAKLRLFARLSNSEATNVVTAIYPVANSSWTENGINFNNRPPSGTSELARFTVANTTGQWHEVDLTNYLKAEKAAGRNLVSLALKNLANASPITIVNSDEATANRPQLVITPGTPSSQTSLPAVADSYVRDGTSANTNFGGQSSIIVKRGNTGNNRHSYLLFDLASVSTINSAKLRLFGGLSDNRVTNIPTAVYGTAGGAWGESTITWNNRPPITTGALATVTVTDATLRWYEWDLTAYLKQQKAAGKNQVTLVLQNLAGGDPQTAFNSREAASNRPELLIT
jgi:PKD repeat protein